jgi:hypothetical protein
MSFDNTNLNKNKQSTLLQINSFNKSQKNIFSPIKANNSYKNHTMMFNNKLLPINEETEDEIYNNVMSIIYSEQHNKKLDTIYETNEEYIRISYV